MLRTGTRPNGRTFTFHVYFSNGYSHVCEFCLNSPLLLIDGFHGAAEGRHSLCCHTLGQRPGDY